MAGLSNGTKNVEVVGVVRLIKVQKALDRWFKEKWVDVSRKDKDGKHPPCGRKEAKTSSKGYPKCRPSVRVSSKTPKTAGEMTSGQKQAATKRKRSKRQGVKGKPTVVKGDPMDLAMRLLKASRQTELGEHHPELPSSHGPIVYYHGTSPEKTPRIKQQGLRARTLEDMVKDKFFRDLEIPRENRRQLSDEQEFQLEHQLTNARRDYYDRHHDDYPGAYVSTSPRVKHTYGTGGLVGIRAGAGSPEPYFGVGDGWNKKRLFPDSWRFSENVPPEYLVNMSNYKFPDVPIDEKPEFFTHPPFYVDGQPPEIKQEEDFDEASWYDKWGGQNERKDIDLPSYWNPDLVNSLPEWDPNQDQHYQRFLQGKPE